MSLPFFHPSHSYRNSSSGLTLIEMMVVITIFIIMTAVVMANFPAFRDKTGLQLIAQEIATTIRQAQVFGIGTRAAGALEFPSHGIYFDLDGSGGLDNKTFLLYADKKTGGTPGQYDTADNIIEKFSIRGAAKIDNLQGCNPNPTICTSLSPQKLDILFQRFYPEASFPSLAPATPSYVKIVLKSTRTNDQKWVEVWNTGQIVVADPPTP